MLHRELLPLAQQVVLLDFFQSLLLDVLLFSEGNDCGIIKLLCPRTEAENIGLLATEATETGSREQLAISQTLQLEGNITIQLNRTRNLNAFLREIKFMRVV